MHLGSREAAEDVFQQTFLQIHLKCDQFEAGRKVRPWLYTIATNQAIDYQRQQRGTVWPASIKGCTARWTPARARWWICWTAPTPTRWKS